MMSVVDSGCDENSAIIGEVFRVGDGVGVEEYEEELGLGEIEGTEEAETGLEFAESVALLFFFGQVRAL